MNKQIKRKIYHFTWKKMGKNLHDIDALASIIGQSFQGDVQMNRLRCIIRQTSDINSRSING